MSAKCWLPPPPFSQILDLHLAGNQIKLQLRSAFSQRTSSFLVTLAQLSIGLVEVIVHIHKYSFRSLVIFHKSCIQFTFFSGILHSANICKKYIPNQWLLAGSRHSVEPPSHTCSIHSLEPPCQSGSFVDQHRMVVSK